jgi:hypothetical protein
MTLFKCQKCNCVENTALCRFWFRKPNEIALCSECDPKIGKWHNCFPKRKMSQKECNELNNKMGDKI